MMTKIEEDCVFVHASDIQLLNHESISQIESWKPDILLASGPPIYLSKLSKDQIKKHGAMLYGFQKWLIPSLLIIIY